MRLRLPGLLAAVALLALDPSAATAAWTASGEGGAAARAAVLAPPTGLTVVGQACSPTASGASTIAYRDGTTAAGTVAVVVPRPALTAAGDLLLAAYSIRSSGATVTAPAGWSLLRLDVYAGKNITSGLWYRTAAEGDPTTWTWSASVTGLNAVAAVAAYSGVAAVGAHGVSVQGGTQVVAPSLVTGTDGSRLVGVFAIHNNEVLTTPPGMTPRLARATPDVNGGGNHQMTVQVADESWGEGTAPTGTRTAVSAGGTDSIGHAVALVPPTPVGSTITAVGSSTAVGSTSVTVTVPTGTQVGDLLLLGYAKRKVPASVTSPAGWTVVRYDASSATDYLQALSWRWATAADVAGASHAFTTADTSKAAVVLVAYRGVDRYAPVVAQAGQGGSGSDLVTAPSITPSRLDTRLVGFFGGSDGRLVEATAAGMVSRAFVGTAVGGAAEVSLEVEDTGWSQATATGARTVTLSGNARWVGQLVALKPESHPLVSLAWTPSTSGFADGQQLHEEVGGLETPVVTLGATSASWTMGETPRLVPGSTHDLRLYARASAWWSTTPTDASFTALTTC